MEIFKSRGIILLPSHIWQLAACRLGNLSFTYDLFPLAGELRLIKHGGVRALALQCINTGKVSANITFLMSLWSKQVTGPTQIQETENYTPLLYGRICNITL